MRATKGGKGAVLGALWAVLLPGCVTVSGVQVVDRKTALEEQASGDLRPLEAALAVEVLTPGPVPLTRSELVAAGADDDSAFRRLTSLHQGILSRAAQVDEWLVRRCVGEALDGRLVETPETCIGTWDPGQVSPVIQRVNRDREQLWQELAAGRASGEEVRKAWRRRHLEGLVCGGQVQGDDGRWDVKACP